MLFLAGLVGFVGGLGSGLFGIGGGSIRIPLLNLIGFSLIAAFGINLLALPVTASIGAISQKHNIDFKLGSYMILGGSIGTVIGTLIAFSLATSEFWLAIIFLIASLVAVAALNLKHISPNTSEKLTPTKQAVTSGTCACNILTGMRGGSEGSLFVPLLKMFNIDTHKAIATSLFAAVLTSIVGVILYWSQGYLLIVEGTVVMVGAVIGSRIGSLISLQTKSRSLEIGLSVLIISLAAVTFLNSVFI